MDGYGLYVPACTYTKYNVYVYVQRTEYSQAKLSVLLVWEIF